MTSAVQRMTWLVSTVALVAGLAVLDAARAGPATPLSGCNLALARSGQPAADVLVLGSSRVGTALDPVAMQRMLAADPSVGEPTAERIALGRSPLKATVGLLETYLEHRGDPAVIVFEVSFMIQRTVDRISQQFDRIETADALLFGRDVNLLTYDQLLTTPAVALPLSEPESLINRLRYSLRGVVLRSGALAYQFIHEPGRGFSVDECGVDDLTREPSWPADFAFSWDENERTAAPPELIAALRAAAAAGAETRELQAWQLGRPNTARYPYDVAADYRSGELALLDRAVALAADRNIPMVLILLPTYGSTAGAADVAALESRYAGDAQIYDVYPDAGVDLSTYWYDDAHLQPSVAGELITALVTQYLIERTALAGS